MIRRRADASFLLITQSCYARAAASLVPCIGGATFSSPGNRAGLQSAVAIAESGFDRLDENPILSPTGRPMHFGEFTLPILLSTWSRSADAAEPAGHYPAFLVSLLALQRSAILGKSAQTLREVFEVNKQQHREIERLERLRPVMGLRNDIPMRYGLPDRAAILNPAEQNAVYDYHLLVMLLQLTLEVAIHQRISGDLGPFPTSPAGNSVILHFRWTDATHLSLTPWPFACPTCELILAATPIPSRLFDHEQELIEACELAAPRPIHAILASPDLELA